MQVQRVLVMGGGVGGLAVAAALGKRGVQVDLAELRPDSDVLGVGINQPANSLRVLDSLGVLEECERVGFQYAKNEFFDWQGNLIVAVPSAFGDDRIPANNALSRLDLQRILHAAAQGAGAKFEYGVTLEDLVEEENHVRVTLTGGRVEDYDLVVGFDGIKSPLRQRLFGTEHDPEFTGYAVWRLTLPRPPEVTHTMLFQGDGTKAGVIPLSEHSMYLLHVTPEPGNPKYDPRDFGALLKERLAGYGGLIGRLRDSIEGPDGIVYSPLSEVHLPAPWYVGRTIVLGDAAHASAPHLTQGAAMALEDAWVLTEELDSDRPLADCLAAFMARRVDRVKLVQDVSHAILFGEMAVTADHIADAAAHMAQALPGQMAHVETVLNQRA
jgi:2-polyprenyl-6-methoxyphenol hydroxylase-like FAD-dependent oxidoreductase